MDLFEMASSLAQRDAAIASVTVHADENIRGWRHEAAQYVRRYASIYREFVSEDCTDWAYANGLAKPHDSRAMGQVYRDEAKAGTIRNAGAGRSKKRASPTVLWASCHPNFAEAA